MPGRPKGSKNSAQHVFAYKVSVKQRQQRDREEKHLIACAICGEGIPWKEGIPRSRYLKRVLCDDSQCISFHRRYFMGGIDQRSYMSYSDFCTTARSAGIRHHRDYLPWWQKNQAVIDGLPSHPDQTYRAEWEGWRVALQTDFCTLDEFIAKIVELGITSRSRYSIWWKATAPTTRHERDDRMPSEPTVIYGIEWKKLLPDTWHGRGNKSHLLGTRQSSDWVEKRIAQIRGKKQSSVHVAKRVASFKRSFSEGKLSRVGRGAKLIEYQGIFYTIRTLAPILGYSEGGLKRRIRESTELVGPKADHSQQSKAAWKNRVNKSGLPRGVRRVQDSLKYAASMWVNGKSKHLGCFGTVQEAETAYRDAQMGMPQI